MSDAEAAEQFGEFLRREGLKFTPQRRAVLRQVYRQSKHFSADDLIASLRSSRGRISRATVYRTLNLLVEAGLLEAVDFDKGFLLYERSAGVEHHDHLICVGCSRVQEFHDEEIEALQRKVARRHGFRMESHTMRIFGRCAACQAREERGGGRAAPPRER